MKFSQGIRLTFQVAALGIFIFQAQQSLRKYFEYPVVIQQSEITSDQIEKPTFLICIEDAFDYKKADMHGYELRSKFLAGMRYNSTMPTWKGKYGNSSFEKLIDELYDKDFSKVDIDTKYEFEFIFNIGFCLTAFGFNDLLKVTSKNKKLRIFLEHVSTSTRIAANQRTGHVIEIGPTSNDSFIYTVYQILYHVHDNTIFDGLTCSDYRNKNQGYRDCIYDAYKEDILLEYGCYPPWITVTDGDNCAAHSGLNITKEDFHNVWKDLDSLTNGLSIGMMKQCLRPCYTVDMTLVEMTLETNFKEHAILQISNTESVQVSKATYSFDAFMLAVELGSALGLWLGMNMLKTIMVFHYTLEIVIEVLL